MPPPVDALKDGARKRSWLILAIAGLVVGSCFAGMALLPNLRQDLVPFLILYTAAYAAYGVAVWWVLRKSGGRRELGIIIGLAVLFRAALLFTSPPTLSSDVYRYIWDGRLANLGVNPYAHPVNAPLLDPFDSPQRALVNHDWMASPYLPAAQLLFAAVYRLAPGSPLAFQVTTVLLDLLTGWLVIDLLRRIGMPRARALIYLWNPLVIVEFAHGAHVVDGVMICLIMTALWALIAARSRALSAVALATATLTKGLPVLLLPAIVRRWGLGPTVLYASLAIAACVPLALGAGWGLTGPLDGTGLFGALRIYGALWEFNSGLYHWIEALAAGSATPTATIPGAFGWHPVLTAKLAAAAALLAVLGAIWYKGRRSEGDLDLLRLAIAPLATYLLLTTTVHPWYVTLVIPLLPFLTPRMDARAKRSRHLLPWLYFALAVAFSYLAYRDVSDPRAYDVVRLLEYVPLYLLLIWSSARRRGVLKDVPTCGR